MEKRCDGLHRSTENSHLQTEDAQTRKKGQVDFTETQKTVTYMLKMHRHREKIRGTSQKHWKQSLTFWGCTDTEKRSTWLHRSTETVTYKLRVHKQGSGELHRSTENSHLYAKSAQTRRKDQGDLTKALKTVTYNLRMHRHREKIRWTSLKHWKQSLTS